MNLVSYKLGVCANLQQLVLVFGVFVRFSLDSWVNTLVTCDEIRPAGSLPDCGKLNTGTINQVVSFDHYWAIITKQCRVRGLSTPINLAICFFAELQLKCWITSSLVSAGSLSSTGVWFRSSKLVCQIKEGGNIGPLLLHRKQINH